MISGSLGHQQPIRDRERYGQKRMQRRWRDEGVDQRERINMMDDEDEDERTLIQCG